MTIINKDSVSFTEIKEDVLKWISGLSNADTIYNTIPASNLTFIVDLIAGYAAYDNFKRVAEARQTVMSEVTRASSAYKIARCFGYNIGRYTCPTFSVKYNDIPTITLTNGQILGTIGKYDIMYWGSDRVIEKGDVFDLVIGHYTNVKYSVSATENLVEYSLTPDVLSGIDNEKVRVIVDNKVVEVTKDVEAYVVHNKVIDWSDTISDTTISVADRDMKYGVDVGSSVRFQWIESDGYLEFDQNDLELDERFLYLSTTHVGSNGDSIEKIKRLAPLYYSTQRRMVSRFDHRVIIESSPLIESCYPDVDPGDPEVLKYTINGGDPEGVTYMIRLMAYDHTYVGKAGDSLTDIVNGLLKSITLQGDISVVATGTDFITVSIDDTMVSPVYGSSENITIEVIDQWIRPRCCTMNAYYVKYNTVNATPQLLTASELLTMADFLEVYKMVGYRIVFTPAIAVSKSLKLNLRVTDQTYWNDVITKINEIVASYNLVVNKSFEYGVLLADIGAIEIITPEYARIKPVAFVAPNQEMFDVAGSIDKYLYFGTPTITPV